MRYELEEGSPQRAADLGRPRTLALDAIDDAGDRPFDTAQIER